MTIILKPFSAPTVQFPKKEKPPILNPIPPLSFYFIGIISISSMRVLFQPPILLALFWTNLLCWLNAISYCYSIYCVYLFAATALSIWCITHLYIDYLSAPLDQIHLSYTLHFLMMFYSSNSLFGVVEVTRFFMCCGWPLSWSNTRSVEDPLRCHLIHANSNLQCEQQRRADAPFPLYWSSTWHSIKTYFSQHHSALLALRDIEKQIAWALLKSLKIWGP